MTSWPWALRERFGGAGTFSGRKASVGDFGMIGPRLPSPAPFCPYGPWLFWFVSLTVGPFQFGVVSAFCAGNAAKTGSEWLPAPHKDTVKPSCSTSRISPRTKPMGERYLWSEIEQTGKLSQSMTTISARKPEWLSQAEPRSSKERTFF
jgi:hypothetical protein